MTNLKDDFNQCGTHQIYYSDIEVENFQNRQKVFFLFLFPFATKSEILQNLPRNCFKVSKFFLNSNNNFRKYFFLFFFRDEYCFDQHNESKESQERISIRIRKIIYSRNTFNNNSLLFIILQSINIGLINPTANFLYTRLWHNLY